LLGGGAAALAHAAGDPPPPARRDAGGVAGQAPEAGQPAPGAKPLVISLGVTERLQMKGKQEIKRAHNPKENVAVVSPVPDDPTSVNITGREAGTTRITLTAADDTEEVYDVIVQLDVEYLRLLLQRAVPTASLSLLPASGGTVVIGGTVNHAEDIDVIMRTAQSVVGSGERVVNAMRVAGVQLVQLDAVIAFVSRSELRRMSFDFLEVGLKHNFSSTVGGALINPAPSAVLPSTPGFPLNIVNVVPNAPNGAPVNFFLGVSNDKQGFFGLLQLLRNENVAKVLAEPKIVTLSGRSARLLSGGQQAIPETAGLGSVSVRFEPFGTQLFVLPIVLGNGKIQLEVNPIVSNIDAAVGTVIAGTVVPGRNQQEVQTTVVVETGQTLVIGGLIQRAVTGVTQKTPILGDLPVLGAAFRSLSYQEIEQELVVLITPYLVDPMACNQLPKYYPGQETRSPDDCELFLEGILEAPRGPRDVCPGGCYVPAYKNGPTADMFPCGNGSCPGAGACGSKGPNGSDGPVGHFAADARKGARPQSGSVAGTAAAQPSQPAPSSSPGMLPAHAVSPAAAPPQSSSSPAGQGGSVVADPPALPALPAAGGPDGDR
jgi:pilus assembly protein CpaC